MEEGIGGGREENRVWEYGGNKEDRVFRDIEL